VFHRFRRFSGSPASDRSGNKTNRIRSTTFDPDLTPPPRALNQHSTSGQPQRRRKRKEKKEKKEKKGKEEIALPGVRGLRGWLVHEIPGIVQPPSPSPPPLPPPHPETRCDGGASRALGVAAAGIPARRHAIPSLHGVKQARERERERERDGGGVTFLRVCRLNDSRALRNQFYPFPAPLGGVISRVGEGREGRFARISSETTTARLVVPIPPPPPIPDRGMFPGRGRVTGHYWTFRLFKAAINVRRNPERRWDGCDSTSILDGAFTPIFTGVPLHRGNACRWIVNRASPVSSLVQRTEG